MRKIEKSEIYGIVGATVFGILLIILLFIFKFSYILSLDDEGLTVNFGDPFVGKGFFEPAPASVLQPTAVPKPTPPPPTPKPPAPDKFMTQNTEDAFQIEEARKKEQQRKQEEQKRKQEEEERKRVEQERIAEQKRQQEEQARRVAEINARTQGAFSGAGTNANSTGEGDTGTAGNQGNPLGGASGSPKGGGVGSSFNLGGRGVSGTLPKPGDNTQVEGVIVVDIVVDESGNVTGASIGKGTNITETVTRNAALSAAKKAKFSKGTKVEMGTITYRFTLN